MFGRDLVVKIKIASQAPDEQADWNTDSVPESFELSNQSHALQCQACVSLVAPPRAHARHAPTSIRRLGGPPFSALVLPTISTRALSQ